MANACRYEIHSISNASRENPGTAFFLFCVTLFDVTRNGFSFLSKKAKTIGNSKRSIFFSPAPKSLTQNKLSKRITSEASLEGFALAFDVVKNYRTTQIRYVVTLQNLKQR